MSSLRNLRVRDFSGGPNLRDAQSELAKNECVDAWNVTFDERGGVSSRLGYQKVNGSVYGGGLVKNVYYSPLLGEYITQAGASLYLGTNTTIRKTFTTSARVVFVDFGATVVALHPVDGLFTSADGITWAAVADVDAPKGSCMAVWQNKVWVSGHAAAPARLYFSDVGSVTSWTASSFNDLREKDTQPIVALSGAAGVDTIGRPGLLVFKRESTYRVYDSTTGAYQTVDSRIGAASALSVVTLNNRTIALSQHGLYWTDGVNPMKNAGERFEPLWEPTQVNFAQLDLWAAGARFNRAYFSLTRAGSTANDLALEYHPEEGWVTPGSNAMSAYATFGASTEKLYGGSPTVSGQVYELLVTGADDGVAIDSRFQTRWFEPGDGFLARLRRARLLGRTGGLTITVTVRRDYQTSAGDDLPVIIDELDTESYDSGVFYDSGALYGTPAAQAYHDEHSLGTCKAFSLRITASTSTVGNTLQLLASGTGPEVGAWAFFGFDLLFVPLGIA